MSTVPKICGFLDANNRNKSIPLKNIAVHADIRGLTSAVSAELIYENSSPDVIECEFVFPLTDSSAVYKLHVEIAGRTIVAECRPREEAEQTYRDAIHAGNQAALLENESNVDDIFRILLGNLPPGGTARISIGYVQPLDREPDGVLTLNLPSVLNPRYAPSNISENPDEIGKHFHLTVPYIAMSAISYEMNFDANISLGVSGKIGEIKAASDRDNLNVEYGADQDSASVKLTSKFVPDHDFRLHITPNDPWRPVVYVEPGIAKASDSGANWLHSFVASAWFEPKQQDDHLNNVFSSGDEYWFVVDRSGSMSGSKISQAKEALLLFVKSLPVGCKFSVVGFGSNYKCLFDKSVEYTESNVNQAVKHSKGLEADMGGTKILEPLKYIYSLGKPAARRFIILLTDGEVSNTEGVIRLVADNASTSRVFAVGIGEGASTALVNGVARVSGGLSEFVRSDKDRLQGKVISLLKACTNPPAENVILEWTFSGGKLASLSPKQLPTAVYHGRAISQYAFFERHEGNAVDGTVKLTAVINGKPTSYSLNFSISSTLFSDADDALPLHRLAAKSRLLELEHERDEAVAISVATGVLCKHTALVAVDRSNTVDGATNGPNFVKIPRPIENLKFACPPSGMDLLSCSIDANMQNCMLLRSGFDSSMALRSKSARKKSVSFFGDIGRSLSRMFTFGGGSSAKRSSSAMSKEAAPVAVSTSSPLQDLISLQKVNGSWELKAELKRVVNISLDKCRSVVSECLAELSLPASSTDELIATIVALTFLRHKYAEKQDEWQLIEMKAVSFLTKSNGVSADQVDALVGAFAKKSAF